MHRGTMRIAGQGAEDQSPRSRSSPSKASSHVEKMLLRWTCCRLSGRRDVLQYAFNGFWASAIALVRVRPHQQPHEDPTMEAWSPYLCLRSSLFELDEVLVSMFALAGSDVPEPIRSIMFAVLAARPRLGRTCTRMVLVGLKRDP